MATQTHHVVSLSEQEFIRLFAKATQTNGYMRTAQPSAFIGTKAEKTVNSREFLQFGSPDKAPPQPECLYLLLCAPWRFICVNYSDLSDLNICSSGEMGINWLAGQWFGWKGLETPELEL